MSNTFRYFLPERGETVADSITFTTIWDEEAIDYVAQCAAEHEHRLHRGTEWPLTLVLLDPDDEELGRFRVTMALVPEFDAQPVKETA